MESLNPQSPKRRRLVNPLIRNRVIRIGGLKQPSFWSCFPSFISLNKIDIPCNNLGKLLYFTNLNSLAIWGWFPLLIIIYGFRARREVVKPSAPQRVHQNARVNGHDSGTDENRRYTYHESLRPTFLGIYLQNMAKHMVQPRTNSYGHSYNWWFHWGYTFSK